VPNSRLDQDARVAGRSAAESPERIVGCHDVEMIVTGSVAGPQARDTLAAAATIGIGSLPHRDARQAAEFAFEAFEIPTAPSLPRRSPAESPIAQALVGVMGVTLGQYGAVAVDPSRLDPASPVRTDVTGDQFAGLRAFLDLAVERRHIGPLAWHFTGPIAVAIALQRAGASHSVAFDVAVNATRSHVRAISDHISLILPESEQIAIIHEPSAGAIDDRSFPLSTDEIIDVLSSTMAAVERRALVGVHSCAPVDVGVLIAAGPGLLCLPVASAVARQAAHIGRFLETGGTIAWGAVATAGPIGVTASRSLHQLEALWSELAFRGCSMEALRSQSLLSPECGLGSLGVGVADRVCRSLHDVARTVRRRAHPASSGT
jgi:hypothetical protein